MTSAHRLIAIVGVWIAFAMATFALAGVSITLFMPTSAVILLAGINAGAALLATALITRIRGIG